MPLRGRESSERELKKKDQHSVRRNGKVWKKRVPTIIEMGGGATGARSDDERKNSQGEKEYSNHNTSWGGEIALEAMRRG